jgi:hypothetical protein
MFPDRLSSPPFLVFFTVCRAKRPAFAGFQLFRGLHFDWRVSVLPQVAQNQILHVPFSPRDDPALQGSCCT